MDYREYYEARSRDRKKSRRFKIAPRFIVFVAVVLAVIIIPIALLSGTKEYLVGYGAYDAVGEGFDALIIRDEIPYYSETFGDVSYKVVEGKDVRGGDLVLDLFASDYTGQLLAELQSVRDRIKTHQEDSLLNKIVDPQMDEYNAQIQQQLAIIKEYTSGTGESISAAELRLNELMTERQNYLKTTSVAQADSVLTELYASETQLMGRIENWRTAYLAPQNGRVSVYFDGLEPALGAATIEILELAHANALLAGEKPSDIVIPGQPLYRIVNPNRWFIIFTASASGWQAGIGQEVLINIEGYDGISATATVRRSQSDERGKTTMVILEVSKDIGSLIGERLTYITIGSNTEGLMVPKKAVKQVNGVYGVYLTDSESTFVPVDILVSDGQHSIVMPTVEGALEKGMKIKPK